MVLWALVAAVPLLIVGLWQSPADAGSEDARAGGPVSTSQSGQQAAANEGYWTKQRMENAIPMDAGYPLDADAVAESAPPPASTGPPGYVPGSRGGEIANQRAAQTESDAATTEQPQHGTKPSNPLTGPYGPFQRFSLRGVYTEYPVRTIGKLFFTLNGSNFVCSASTYGTDRIVTAGHCVSDGTSTFATRVNFCPAYRNGSTPFGCWDNWTSIRTSGPWHVNGDPDYDYARVVFGNDTSCACLVGNRVGFLGVGWNWGISQPDMSFGYPQASPFAGGLLVQVASTDWYTHDFTSGGQVSKVMGNDMTGGSSGGPWILGWRHPSAEVADTDGSNATDPAGPFVNGVNSHKRCRTTCQSPPTATNGVFWQEMTSPPFQDTSDPNDVRAVLQL